MFYAMQNNAIKSNNSLQFNCTDILYCTLSVFEVSADYTLLQQQSVHIVRICMVQKSTHFKSVVVLFMSRLKTESVSVTVKVLGMNPCQTPVSITSVTLVIAERSCSGALRFMYIIWGWINSICCFHSSMKGIRELSLTFASISNCVAKDQRYIQIRAA